MRYLRNTLILSALALLSSCRPPNIVKVMLPPNSNGTGELLTITNNTTTLETLINDEETFLLAGYLDEFCGCWVGFRDNVISTYVANFDVNIYTVDIKLFTDTTYELPFDLSVENTVFFAVYEEGSYKYGTVNYQERPLFQNYNLFKEWVARYIEIQ